MPDRVTKPCTSGAPDRPRQARRLWRIPILMYHGVGDQPEGSQGSLHTTRRAFADQVQYLRSHNYRTLDLMQALAELRTGSDPGRAVVITFDDGYEDFYTTAVPILQSAGFTATVFVIPSYVGRRRSRTNPHTYMNWQQIREVESNGMTIGSHSLTHPVLHKLTREQIGTELRESKRILEDALDTEVHTFAYPYAYPEQATTFTRFVTTSLQSFGYRAAVSTIIGRADSGSDPFLLPRIPISSRDGQWLFPAKVRGWYDCARFAQSISKRLAAGRYPQWRTPVNILVQM